MQAVQVRAADSDRERTLAELQRHTVAGRLDMDEFSGRAAAVYRSRTIDELAALIADLPPHADDAAATRIPWRAWIGLSVAGIVVMLFGVALSTPVGSMMGCI